MSTTEALKAILMGEVLYFPTGNKRACGMEPVRIGIQQPIMATPVEILEELLVQAKANQFVFLAVHAFRTDGSCVHIEIGLVDPQSEDPPEAS